MLKKAKVGVRLRRFREERGLTQAALAQALGISASYVNQMESNQRPVTVPVLLKLGEVFDVDLQQFSSEESDRLVAQLRDVVTESMGERISQAELRELSTSMPAVARYVIEMHRRYRHAVDLNEAMAVRIDSTPNVASPVPAPMAYEEVRDLFYAHRNYFAVLDEAAEQLFADAGLAVGDPAPGLADRLLQCHDIRVVDLAGNDAIDVKRRYDRASRTLAISPLLSSGQRAFQIATHLAFLEYSGLIDGIVAQAALSSDETESLARIGLANYFAGAVILPYEDFRNAAERLRYDLDLLQRRYRVGFETVAHRLSTLQRPGMRGVPLFFVRVDRAGNISKRQSATDFHFSRVGGTCPLWNVYEAFAHPGQIRRQLAQMPDGRSYLWVARTVSRRNAGYGTPAKFFAIGIGCDLQHAHRLVYSDGLDLANPGALTPIGPGCKVCDRNDCPQRAFPAIGKDLDVNRQASRFVPYRHHDDTGEAPLPMPQPRGGRP